MHFTYHLLLADSVRQKIYIQLSFMEYLDVLCHVTNSFCVYVMRDILKTMDYLDMWSVSNSAIFLCCTPEISLKNNAHTRINSERAKQGYKKPGWILLYILICEQTMLFNWRSNTPLQTLIHINLLLWRQILLLLLKKFKLMNHWTVISACSHIHMGLLVLSRSFLKEHGSNAQPNWGSSYNLMLLCSMKRGIRTTIRTMHLMEGGDMTEHKVPIREGGKSWLRFNEVVRSPLDKKV